MAMLPFCGYNMADYLKHWIDIGKKMKKPPKIFHVNWFRVNAKGKFMWPGFSDNLRVIEWILDRCNNKVPAKKTPIGYIPRIEHIDTTGLSLPKETLRKLLYVGRKEWRKEAKEIEKFFKIVGVRLPAELKSELAALKKRLKK